MYTTCSTYGRVREISVLMASTSSEGSGESAHAQTGQSLSFSHAQSMDVNEGSGQNLDLYLRLI